MWAGPGIDYEARIAMPGPASYEARASRCPDPLLRRFAPMKWSRFVALF